MSSDSFPASVTDDRVTSTPNTDRSLNVTDVEDAMELLLLDGEDVAENNSSTLHEHITAPLITKDAWQTSMFDNRRGPYGILGSVKSIHDNKAVTHSKDPRVYINTNAPLSAIICGVQGSGKSHTVSVLLENMLVPSYRAIGSLSDPLSGLVLHFGEGGKAAQPCEAAYLGRTNISDVTPPDIVVYCAKSSLATMTRVYHEIGDHIEVFPLLLYEDELDAEGFLSMMAVGSSEGAPLYIQKVLTILRDLGERFTYSALLQEIDLAMTGDFNTAQKAGLNLRMSILQSFMHDTNTSGRTNTSAPPRRPRFKEGQLTIIDLSDPFIDSNSATAFFEIVVRLFVRDTSITTGKVLLLDEAHQYLSAKRVSTGFTKTLLSLIRKQRHYGMRVLISTQEPTVVPPTLLDLCTVSILHRFSSPSWWLHLSSHVASRADDADIIDEIIKLPTGQAIIIAPSSMILHQDSDQPCDVVQLGRRFMTVKIRSRITDDGGNSILAEQVH